MLTKNAAKSQKVAEELDIFHRDRQADKGSKSEKRGEITYCSCTPKMFWGLFGEVSKNIKIRKL